MTTVVLTRPVTGSAGIPGTITTDVVIPGVGFSPANIVVADQCPTISNVSVKWIYTLVDQIANKVVSGEVLAVHRNGSNPSHNRYALIGDGLQHLVDVVIIGSDIGLKITNLETNTLTATIVRIQVLSV